MCTCTQHACFVGLFRIRKWLKPESTVGFIFTKRSYQCTKLPFSFGLREALVGSLTLNFIYLFIFLGEAARNLSFGRRCTCHSTKARPYANQFSNFWEKIGAYFPFLIS